MGGRWWPHAVGVVALVLSIGCGGRAPAAPGAAPQVTPASVERAVAGASDARAANMRALYEKARAAGENEVVLKSGAPATDAVAQESVAAFQEEFPGIKLTYVTTPLPQITVQVTTEATAGKISTDVGNGTIGQVAPLVERDLLVSHDWSQLFDPADLLQLDGKLVRNFDSPLVLAYNTDRLSADEVPRTWEDLLEPRFRDGKLAFSASGADFTGLFWERGEDAAVAYLEKLKEQRPRWGTNRPETEAQLTSGQVALAVMVLPAYLRNKAKGAPVALTSLGPFANGNRASYVVKGAPHPNAALLLVGWLQSPKGRDIWERNYYGMAAPCSAGPMAQAICESNVRIVELDTAEKSVQDDAWARKAAQTIGVAAR